MWEETRVPVGNPRNLHAEKAPGFKVPSWTGDRQLRKQPNYNVVQSCAMTQSFFLDKIWLDWRFAEGGGYTTETSYVTIANGFLRDVGGPAHDRSLNDTGYTSLATAHCVPSPENLMDEGLHCNSFYYL